MNWKYLIPLFVLAVACEAPIMDDNENNSTVSNESLSAILPIEGTEAVPTLFQVNAEQAQTIDLGNGGSLKFPENAFVDQDGNPVKGKVDVEWQEFHTLGDILLSGIPMKYDSAGVQHDLVSGGMFTIHASQKGKPVEIAPQKKVEVNIASIQDTPCYNFYEMDEQSGTWTYETTKEGTPIEKEEKTEAAAPSQPDILDVTLNTKAFPELAKLDIVGWEAKRSLSDGEKAILKRGSTRIRLTKTDSLGLTLEAKTAADQTLSFPVEPYTLDQAMKDSKENKKVLDQSLAEVETYAKEWAAGRVIRSIEIDNFGTYNWDIVNKRENSRRLMAKFTYPEKVNTNLVSLYLLSPDENAIVRYNPEGDDKFSFDPKLKNCIIAILPGNKVASVSNQGFSKARTLKNGQACEFVLRDSGIKLKSAKDIMNHMNELI